MSVIRRPSKKLNDIPSKKPPNERLNRSNVDQSRLDLSGGDLTEKIGVAHVCLRLTSQGYVVEIRYLVQEVLGRRFARISALLVRIGPTNGGDQDRRVQHRLHDDDKTNDGWQRNRHDDNRRFAKPYSSEAVRRDTCEWTCRGTAKMTEAIFARLVSGSLLLVLAYQNGRPDGSITGVAAAHVTNVSNQARGQVDAIHTAGNRRCRSTD